MSRVLNVARMQLINKWTYLGVPAIIIAGAFAVSWIIWWLIPDDFDGNFYSGAGQAVMWYFLVLGIQSLTLTFPFSQGLSISRRTFYLGTVGLFAVVALAVSALYVLLAVVERATNGWGVNGRMFALPWISDGPWYQAFLFYFVAMVLLFMIGFWIATIYKRWLVWGMVILSIAAAVVLVVLIGFTTWTGSWPDVGQWFVRQTPLSVSGWVGVTCVVLAGASYLTLRKAAP